MMYTETIKLESVITDIAAGPFGSNLKVSCFVDYGFPIIDGANLKGFKVTDNVTKFVTEEKARSLHRSIAKRNDVIVTISGTLGQIAYIPENSMFEEYLCSQRQFRVSFDTERVFVPYLVYYFHSREGQHKILSFANQTGVPALSQPLKNFRNIEVDLPDIDTQKQIASVMLSLDDKIELNTAINENLEQQAYLLLEQMLNSPHNQICALSDIAYINPRYTLSKGTEARYIDMSQLSTTTSFPDGWTFRPYNGGMKFKNKDTIMARITPCLENGKTAYIDFLEEDETAFGSTEYIVLSPKDNIPPELLYCIVRYPEFRTYATINMNGSSGRQRVSGEIIGKYEIPSFSQEELSEFGTVAEPLFKQITENSLQNRNLSALRDTLLPKLMNGEIDVSAVEI